MRWLGVILIMTVTLGIHAQEKGGMQVKGDNSDDLLLHSEIREQIEDSRWRIQLLENSPALADQRFRIEMYLKSLGMNLEVQEQRARLARDVEALEASKELQVQRERLQRDIQQSHSSAGVLKQREQLERDVTQRLDARRER